MITIPEKKINIIPKDKKQYSSMDEFISYLMVCRNVLHAMHLKTTGVGSDATHRTLPHFLHGIMKIVYIK